ncbi:MAG: response regulator, partial [Desulfovibrio sp.]|nr:response regulator [Desulfovibrio sp.]
EQALQQSQRRLLEAQRIAHMGHFEHHLDTGIGSWSEEILRIFDLPAGQPAPDFEAFLAGMVDQDDRAALTEALHALKTCDAQTLRELGPPQIDRDLHIRTGSGEMRSVRFTARLEADAQGRAALLRGVLQDVSDRARIMEELVRVTRAAEAANRVKSEFLANMSHEIRTPLHGVMGMLQVLLQSELTPEQREHADIAFSASMRLTNLLSDILDISAVESGKLRLRPAPFSLGEVLESVERLFAVFARERKLTLRIAPDPTLPAMLDGDAQRLRQILFNLVGNALKFTEAGLVTLEAHALQGSHLLRPHLLFVVSDTGLGIPEEIIPTLFEPFSQGALHQPGMVRTAQGVGLGLPIVQQLVTLMGGSLCLASEPGKGSTFYVSLPLGPAGEPSGEPGGAPGSPLPGTAAHPASTHQPLPAARRILVVEDEKVNRLTVRRLLEHHGLEVQEVEDGRAALEALRREPFDLVLMDIQMPGMDGLAVTRAIRQGEAGPASAAIPIVALTAYAMAGDRERFLAAGMDDYLAKPFEFKDIAEVLQRFLPSHPMPPEHDSPA